MNESFNIQRDFLNEARKQRAEVEIYLVNGAKLTGRIKSFDKFTVILDEEDGDQMIFKHAISTIKSKKQFGNYINFDSLNSTTSGEGNGSEEQD